MLYRRVNGFDMPYIEVGHGEPLVCVHGSLCDFRVWASVLGPLSRHYRVIAPSLRWFFPSDPWPDRPNEERHGFAGALPSAGGRSGAMSGPPMSSVGGFTMAQHVSDTIAFIEGIGGPVNLLGHSRGGHIAFRVAEQRRDLLRRLVLAEPGGDLDDSLRLASTPAAPPLRAYVVAAVEKITAGDVDGGLESFMNAIDGEGAWRRLTAAQQQQTRDNARTLVGQVNEQRPPYTRAAAESIRVPTLFVGGADTPGSLPVVLRALAAHVPGARVATIPKTTHVMFEQDPPRFCTVVLDFLASA